MYRFKNTIFYKTIFLSKIFNKDTQFPVIKGIKNALDNNIREIHKIDRTSPNTDLKWL